MADQFLGEIRPVGFNFAPYGWALCNGQILSISQNAALFSLLGTQFGGNGTSTFGLPNLQGSSPMDQGNGARLTPRVMGEVGGEPTVTVLQSQLPNHTHTAQAGTEPGGVTPGPTMTFSGGGRGKPDVYAPFSGPAAVQMSTAAVAPAGGSLPHNNWPPYVTINFVIALQGQFPSRG